MILVSGVTIGYNLRLKILADGDKRQDCPGQLMGEMKHTITYQGSFSADKKVLFNCLGGMMELQMRCINWDNGRKIVKNCM